MTKRFIPLILAAVLATLNSVQVNGAENSPIDRAIEQRRLLMQAGSDRIRRAEAAAKIATKAAEEARKAAAAAQAAAAAATEVLRRANELLRAVESKGSSKPGISYPIKGNAPSSVPRRGAAPARTERLPHPSTGKAMTDTSDQWSDGPDGATRDYFNRGAWLKWQRQGGDWYDAANVKYGSTPYATAPVPDLDQEQTIHWDVTPLVQQWLNRTYPDQGFMLRRLSGGAIVFHARDGNNLLKAPSLQITKTDGSTVTLPVSADTYLVKSTYKSLGARPIMKVGQGANVLLRFRAPKLSRIKSARLEMNTTERQYGAAKIGVFRAAPELRAAIPASSPGIADALINDKKIANDSRVIFAEGFESPHWAKSWSKLQQSRTFERVTVDRARNFEPLSGNALRVKIPKGSHLGLNLRFEFAQKTGREPEEIFFRYYLRIAKGWVPTGVGGKLPGVAGTYGRAGWGGRRSNGTNGWSARGLFGSLIRPGNPLADRLPVGSYVYHADMPTIYGANWYWTNDAAGMLEPDRWYAIEQFVRLNTPGQADGILRGWVDGRLALQRTDIRFRNAANLRIEDIWMNVYYGGRATAPRDLYLYLDNVVIARDYIGPMKRAAKTR